MASLKHDLDRLINSARIKLPGSTDAGIKQELWDTLHEFFYETAMWQEDITVNIVANVTTYSLVPEEPGEIFMLIGAVNSLGDGQPVMMQTIGTMTVRDTPSAATTWTATVAKVPGVALSRDAFPEIPDWVLPVYGPVIQDGLLGRMMHQIKKPYSDPRQGSYHTARFRSALVNARSAVMHRNTYDTNSWRFPQGFRTSGQRGGISTGIRAF